MPKKLITLLMSALLLCLCLTGCGNNTAATSSKEAITVTNEVTKIGPYSQMLRAGGFVYCAAQMAFDPATGKLVDGDITAQTKQVLNNLEAEAADAGITMNDAVKVVVYLADMDDFQAMNTEYAKHFTEPYPVRACVEVSELPVEGGLVSIDVTFLDTVKK